MQLAGDFSDCSICEVKRYHITNVLFIKHYIVLDRQEEAVHIISLHMLN